MNHEVIDMSKKNVLFVCEMNTCRSQMAAGWTRHFHQETINAFSAGIKKGSIDPLAIKVMQEAGVDISAEETHEVKEFLLKDLDMVVTVCSTAAQQCPAFPPEVNVLCHSFDDPPALVSEVGSEEEKLTVYRRVRDEIKVFVQDLPEKMV